MDRTSQQGERRARERTGPPKVPSIGTGLLRGEASDADVSAIDSGQRPLAQGQALIVFIAAKPLGKTTRGSRGPCGQPLPESSVETGGLRCRMGHGNVVRLGMGTRM